MSTTTSLAKYGYAPGDMARTCLVCDAIRTAAKAVHYEGQLGAHWILDPIFDGHETATICQYHAEEVRTRHGGKKA